MVLRYMKRALELAEKAALSGNVPIGALIVRNGEIIAEAENGKYPCEHAEITSINMACKKLDSRNLSDCDIYVTLEPCPMCAGAIMLSGIKNLWFGAYDSKYGACLSKDNSFARFKEISKVNINGGICEEECKAIIKDYFAKKRNTL